MKTSGQYDYLSKVKFLILPFLILAFSSSNYSFPQNNDTDGMSKINFFKPVIDSLLAKGADTSFVYFIVFHQSAKFDEKYLKLSVSTRPSSGSTNNKPYPSEKYAHNYNDYSVSQAKKFLLKYDKLLGQCEKKYGVTKEAITSILWVETRHGGYTGGNHVISVYLSLAMASQPEFFKKNAKSLKDSYNGPLKDWPIYEQKLLERSKKKASWALDQLLALEKMKNLSPIAITELRGSSAGAFGMAQFIPTSYVSWAVDGDGDGKVNLFTAEDAIVSVANYLKINGWEKSQKSHEKAVYHYNNSYAYVYAVLKLAEKLKG